MTSRRAIGRCLVGVVCSALLLQGCGSNGNSRAGSRPARVQRTGAAQNSSAPSYHGPLPALDAVQFVTPQIGFLAGKGIVLATVDGGDQWRQIYQGAANIRAIDFISSTKGWVLTDQGLVLAWNGGGTWQSVAPSLGAAAGMHLASGGAGLILTARGDLYLSTQAGGPWQRVGPSDVRAESFTSGQTGWAVTAGVAGDPTVWRTRDGGKTWNRSFTPKLGLPQGGWTPVIESSGDSAWVLLTSLSGQVEHQPYIAFATADLGGHWQEVLAAPLFAAQGLYPKAPASLYGLQAGPFTISGQSGDFLSWSPQRPSDVLALTATADGGKTWRQLPLQQVAPTKTPDFFAPLGMALAQPSTLWLVGSRNGVGQILVSADGGKSWQAPSL